MTAKFDAFKAALHALCVEHGVHLRGGEGYDDYGVYVDEPGNARQAGLDVELEDCIPLTDEEREERDKRLHESRVRWEAQRIKDQLAYEAKFKTAIESGDYVKLRAAIEAEAIEQRKNNMRVTRIPGDAHDIGAKTCRVWCNEVEVVDWTVADDFRRVVEAPGRVLHGAVRIEMGKGFSIPADAVHLTIAEPAQPIGFHGVFVATPDAPVVEAPAAAAPTFAAPAVKVAPKHISARKRKAGK